MEARVVTFVTHCTVCVRLSLVILGILLSLAVEMPTASLRYVSAQIKRFGDQFGPLIRWCYFTER